MRNLNLIFSITIVLATPYASFADDDSGLYLGVSINRLSADFENENDVDFDDSDNAAGARIGYMFNNFIGVELGYLDLGNYSASSDLLSSRIDLDANAFTGALVLNWNVHNSIDVYGKFGVFYIRADATSNIAGRRLEADEDGAEPFAAIGVEGDFGTWNVFGEFTRLDTDVSELTIDILSAGIKYEFGR